MVEQRIVASKVIGSSPIFYLMFIFKILSSYNLIAHKLHEISINLIINFLVKTQFLSHYYVLNALIWQEGLLIDFLQKKITDNFIKKFLINASYLFNERLLFDNIIKFFLNLIIWPFQKFFIFDFNNISNLFFITIILFIFIFLYLFLYFLIIIIF